MFSRVRLSALCAILVLGSLVSCGPGADIGALMAGKGIGKLTDSLSLLSDEATSLLGEIKDQMASGQITEDLGLLLDERITHLLTEIDDLMSEQMGQAFDRVDGTLLLAFDEIRTTITAIRNELLGDTVDGLLRTLSQELLQQTNAIATRAEDIVVLGTGGAIVAIGKVTHSLMIWTGLGGAALIGLIFLIVRPKAWFFRIFGLVLIVGLLVVGLVPPVRAWVATSAGLAQEFEELKPSPRLERLVPQVFTVGDTPELTLFGSRLDEIEDLSVALYKAGSEQPTLVFPDRAIVGQSRYAITLKNFIRTLNWGPLPFDAVRPLVLATAKGRTEREKLGNYTRYSLARRGAEIERLTDFRLKVVGDTGATRIGGEERRTRMRELKVPEALRGSAGLRSGALAGRVRGAAASEPRPRPAPSNLAVTPQAPQGGSTITAGALKHADLEAFRLSATRHAGVAGAQGTDFNRRFAEMLKKRYRIAAGDYVLRVRSGDEPLPGRFPITIAYPPPPPPKPNLRALSVFLEGNGQPTVGESRRIVVRLEVQEPERIDADVQLEIKANPPIIPDRTIRLRKAQLQGARATNGLLTLRTKDFRLKTPGRCELTLQVDTASAVSEASETDNRATATTRVGRFVQDAVVTILTFKSKRDLESMGDDDYRAEFRVSSGTATGTARWSKEGGPGKDYPVGRTFSFKGLGAGARIDVSYSAREEGSWPDATNDMGSASGRFTVPDPDRASTGAEKSITSSHAVVRVRVDYKRRRIDG